jgi:hypothetical protein
MRSAIRRTIGAPVWAGVVALVAAGSLVGATWNSFPGAWLKNRLELSGDKLARADQRRAALLARIGLVAPPRRMRIVVRKAARRLQLFGDGRELLSVRVGLGNRPAGAKARGGDGRTPEGDYFVCTRNAHSRFHLFLGLSYPNKADAERGLRAGLISAVEQRAIVRAIDAGRQPPWGTRLGGTVGIHGSGSNWDWTLGCVALDDEDIETLWGFVPIGTPVRIEP